MPQWGTARARGRLCRHGIRRYSPVVNTSPSPHRRQWWLRLWVWVLFLLLGGIGWVGWRQYDFQRAVREAEAAGFSFQQSPGPVALIRADWHAAFRGDTWFERKRTLTLPQGCDLALHRPLLLRLRPTILSAKECRNASAIRGLTGLDVLALIGSDVKDLAPLAGLKRLQVLDIEGCTGVADLAPLARLAQLRKLDLKGCTGVTDLAPLAGLAQLRVLTLHGCKGVADLAPLASLSQLQSLDLYDCKGVADLAPLAGLAQLQTLNLNYCTGVADLAPLAGLAELDTLILDGCTGVADIAPLAGLAKLRWLDLDGCPGLSAEAVAAFRKSHPETHISGP